MRTVRYVVVDVFTDQPLAGNQLAVFTDARGLSDAVMQALAREMNFSESVFVLPKERGGHARIRIFTRTRAARTAGHPVLGSAFVLAAPMQLEIIALETGAGIVPVALEREGARIVFGWMVQPTPKVTPVDDPGPLFAALEKSPGQSCRSSATISARNTSTSRCRLEPPWAAVTPDLRALASATAAGVNIFAGEGDQSRRRACSRRPTAWPRTPQPARPPVAAVRLLRHGRIAAGQTIVMDQGAELGRPSQLHARAHGTRDQIERVEVGGAAVVVAHGEFRLRGT